MTVWQVRENVQNPTESSFGSGRSYALKRICTTEVYMRGVKPRKRDRLQRQKTRQLVTEKSLSLCMCAT